jgi:hypothetical protein
MIQVDRSMTRVAIQPERRERPGRSIDRRRVTTRTPISKALFVPGRLLEVDPFQDLPIASEFGLGIEYRELPVSFLLQEAEPMTAPHEIFDLGCYGRERWLALKDVAPLRRVFVLANGDAVRVLLPAGSDVVSMTEQTLITVDEVGYRLPGVASSPRSRIEVLLRLAGGTVFPRIASSIRIQPQECWSV